MEYAALIGSRAYGYGQEGSDYDYYGFYIETKEQLLGLVQAEPKRLIHDNHDKTIQPLRRFMEILKKGGYNAIEALFNMAEFAGLEPLQNNKEVFINQHYYKHLVKAATGISCQANVVPAVWLPTLRHYFYLRHYLATGIFKIKLESDEIEAVLRYKYDYEFIPEKLTKGLVLQLENLNTAALPPDVSDYKVNQILIQLYEGLYYPSAETPANPVNKEALKKTLRKLNKAEKLVNEIAIPRSRETMTEYESNQLELVASLMKQLKQIHYWEEIVWSAMNAIKRQPHISFEAAFEIALTEWKIPFVREKMTITLQLKA